MEERRRYPRYRADLEVKYDVTNDIEIESETHTSNISAAGLAMPLNKAVKPGKKINLVIKLPRVNKTIKAIGKVVWKKPINQNLAQEEDAGIKFLGMHENGAETLTKYLLDISPSAS